MPAPAVGLDITSTAMIAVSLKKRNKSTYAVAKLATASLPTGVINEGEVADVEQLAHHLREFWKSEGIKEKSVAIGIANQRCITRVIDLPRIKRKSELQKAISFEVADNLPIPIEEAVWDFQTVDTFKDEQSGVERQRHVVVMAYRETVERYRDAIEAAGLKLRRIDLSGFALMRAGLSSVNTSLAFELESTGSDVRVADMAIAMCDIGATNTNLVVSRNGICELNRLIAFGTRHFTDTLAQQFGWSVEDAERVKVEAGVVPLGGIEQPGDQYADARRVMQYVTEQFAQELRTSFDYYQHASGSDGKVGRVVLAGEGALLRGIEERFAAELGVPVSILDASPRLDPAAIEQLGINHAQFGTAIGLGMEEAA